MIDNKRTSTFKRNVVWQMAGSAGQALLSGLLLLLVGRQLTASGFGYFSVVMSYVYVANLLLEPRIQDVAAKQFWNFNQDHSTRHAQAPHLVDLFVLEAAAKLIPCLALIAAAPLLAQAGSLPPGSSPLIMVAALGTYLSKLGFGLSIGLLRVAGRSDLAAYCATGELVLRLLLTLAIVALSDLTVSACVAILCISGVVANMLQWVLTGKVVGDIRMALKGWNRAAALSRLKQNRRLLVSNLGLSVSDLMSKDLDVTLLSQLMPAAQIGIYKMAKNITLLTWRAIDPFSLALMPELNRLASMHRYADLKRLIRKSAYGLFGLAAALSCISFVLLTFLGDKVLGPAYADLPGLLPWMLVGIMLSAPLVWGHPLSVAMNRADFAVVGSFSGSLVGLVGFWLLTPAYGTHGASIAWAMTFLTMFTLTSWRSYRLLLMHSRSEP